VHHMYCLSLLTLDSLVTSCLYVVSRWFWVIVLLERVIILLLAILYPLSQFTFSGIPSQTDLFVLTGNTHCNKVTLYVCNVLFMFCGTDNWFLHISDPNVVYKTRASEEKRYWHLTVINLLYTFIHLVSVLYACTSAFACGYQSLAQHNRIQTVQYLLCCIKKCYLSAFCYISKPVCSWTSHFVHRLANIC